MKKNTKSKKAATNQSHQPQEPVASSNSGVGDQTNSDSLKMKSQTKMTEQPPPANSEEHHLMEFQKKILQQVDELKEEIKEISAAFYKFKAYSQRKLNDNKKQLRKVPQEVHQILAHELGRIDLIQKEVETIRSQINSFSQKNENVLNEIKKSLMGYQEMDIPKKLTAIERSFDLLQGKLTVLDELGEKFAHQLGSTRQDLQSANEEEQVLADLAKYGEQILEVLTRAARHYARNREVISHSGQEKHQAELSKVRKESFEEGALSGRHEVVEKIMDLFDLNTLFEGEYPQDKIILSFLQNYIKEDSSFSEGEIIEISPEERAEFEAKAKFTRVGTFEVKKSCLKLGEKIIRKAELEALVAEEEEPDEPPRAETSNPVVSPEMEREPVGEEQSAPSAASQEQKSEPVAANAADAVGN